MTTTLTTPVATDTTRPVATPTALRRRADRLLTAMTEAGLDDWRWACAGPLVSAAAQALRQAFGGPTPECVSVPPVVREADFAQACRPLLDKATVIDGAAARRFLRLADDAALALE